MAASAARDSPLAGADAHQRRAGVVHDRADVGEVEVDQAGDRDQVGDALDALAQDVVGLAERLEDRRARRSTICSSFSFGTMISVSTSLRSLSMPSSGLLHPAACPRTRTAW